jgi:subtilisin family serine protease
LRIHIERLEERSLLSGPGQWPLANPTPANTLLVGFKPKVPAVAITAVLNSLSAYNAGTNSSGTTTLVLGQGISPNAAAAKLHGNPIIKYAESQATYHIATATSVTPNDPSFSTEWDLNNSNAFGIDAQTAWGVTTGTPSTVIAITDTGVDYTHPDLYLNIAINQGEIPATIKASLVDTHGDGLITFYDLNSLNPSGQVVLNSSGQPINAWSTHDYNNNGYIDAGDLLKDPTWINGKDNDGNGYINDIVGWNFVANNNNPFDDNNHGTFVAGTAAGTSNNGIGTTGIDWNARILPVKCQDSTGVGTTTQEANAIDYAANFGAQVINASWGGSGNSTSLSNAISYAGTKGAVFVAAAGNNTSNNDTTPYYPAQYNLANEISVAATTWTGALATFSNYGPKTVQLAAPGYDLYGPLPGAAYAYESGTSVAAPVVSGVVALASGLHPGLSAAGLVNLVDSTTKPVAALAGYVVTGGIVDAYNAVTAVVTPQPAPTPPPAAPTGLAAASASSSSIALSWQGVAGASSYNVLRSLTGSSGWTQVATVSGATLTYLDSGLTASSAYYYEVTDSSSSGTSAPSNIAQATTSAAPAPLPSTTTLSGSAASSTKINLKWNAASFATTYKIQRRLSSGTTWTQIASVASTATTFTDGGVTGGTSYAYEVISSNSTGSSSPSNIANVTTPKKK